MILKYFIKAVICGGFLFKLPKLRSFFVNVSQICITHKYYIKKDFSSWEKLSDLQAHILKKIQL